MPNHYTTIAICSPGWDFDCEEFNEKHEESNLCELVRPMPEINANVHSGSATLSDGSRASTWIERVGPDGTTIREATNEESSIDWAVRNWGTKWGTYNAKALELGGDSSPVAIKFQSAWTPPSILDEIGDWLKRTCGFEKVSFVGFDPYDDSVKML